MKRLVATLCAVAALSFIALSSVATAAQVGRPAPDFTLTDTSGKAHRLADLRGRYVVLEWVNPGCPFVVKHYASGNMQGLQKDWAARNVVWLAVNSTNPQHRDFMKPADLAAWARQQNAAASALLMDADGKVGRAYDARTTPHMFVIDPKGVLVYAGAIDDNRSANAADAKTARNFVQAALSESLAGQPVRTASTQPYGCTVKY